MRWVSFLCLCRHCFIVAWISYWVSANDLFVIYIWLVSFLLFHYITTAYVQRYLREEYVRDLSTYMLLLLETWRWLRLMAPSTLATVAIGRATATQMSSILVILEQSMFPFNLFSSVFFIAVMYFLYSMLHKEWRTESPVPFTCSAGAASFSTFPLNYRSRYTLFHQTFSKVKLW